MFSFLLILISWAWSAPPNHAVQVAVRQGNLIELHKYLADEDTEVRRQATEGFASLAQQEERKADFESFERLRGKEAEKLLESVAEKGDIVALDHIARNYFPTKAGAQAAALLVRHHFNQNRDRTKGAEAADLLRASYWGKDLPPAERILMAYVYLRAARFKEAKEEITRLEASTEKTLRFGKSTCPLKPIADHLAWLAKELGPTTFQPDGHGKLLGVTREGRMLLGIDGFMNGWQTKEKWIPEPSSFKDMMMTKTGVALLLRDESSIQWYGKDAAFPKVEFKEKVQRIAIDPEAPLGTAVVSTDKYIHWIQESKITTSYLLKDGQKAMGCVARAHTNAYWMRNKLFDEACESSDFAVQAPTEIQILRDGKTVERIPASKAHLLARLGPGRYIVVEDLGKDDYHTSWFEKGNRVAKWKAESMLPYKIITHPDGRAVTIGMGQDTGFIFDLFANGKRSTHRSLEHWVDIPSGHFLQDGSFLLHGWTGHNALYDKEGNFNDDAFQGGVREVRQNRNGKTQISVIDSKGGSTLYEDSRQGIHRLLSVSLPLRSPLFSTDDGNLIYQSKQTGKIYSQRMSHPLLTFPQFPCPKEEEEIKPQEEKATHR